MNTFGELAAHIKQEFDAGLACAAIADKLTAKGIAPALGAEAWSKELVDRVLVLHASYRRALEKDATL
jgi:hypothetical protein